MLPNHTATEILKYPLPSVQNTAGKLAAKAMLLTRVQRAKNMEKSMAVESSSALW